MERDRPPSAPPAFPAPLDYAPASDTRAVLSLVLGLASIVTCGLTGLPAIVVGFAAKSAIRRSGGIARGEGIAAWGIATGIFGTVLGMTAIALGLTTLAMSARGTKHAPPPSASAAPYAMPAAPSSPASPPSPTTAGTFGTLRVLDMDPEAPFRDQLESEFTQAQAAHETLILMTDRADCDACSEIDASFSDARMQKALPHVAILRVDIRAFARDLASRRMLEETMPWFYKLEKVGAKIEPTDAVSAGEWDANVPENIAPVLGKFVSGTLKTRHDDSSSIGTPL